MKLIDTERMYDRCGWTPTIWGSYDDSFNATNGVASKVFRNTEFKLREPVMLLFIEGGRDVIHEVLREQRSWN